MPTGFHSAEGMVVIEEMSRLLAVNGYLSHGYCINWSPPLVVTYVVSDILIFLSCFSMPVALGYFARRRKDFPCLWPLLYRLDAAFRQPPCCCQSLPPSCSGR
jgi:hypothetical protein